MKKRRAQAALEFLTTYGWAFMVLLVMIGSLAYFGVLSADSLLPDKCSFEPGIGCVDYAAQKDATRDFISLKLMNNMGKTVKIEGVNASCSAGFACLSLDAAGGEAGFYSLDYSLASTPSNTIISKYWKTDETRELKMMTPTGTHLNSRVKVFVTIQYRGSGEYFSKNISGEAFITP